MTSVAFIPARAHSTRLPGKNLLALGGRSLVARAIDIGRAAQGLGVVDAVVTSVEDWETREEAKRAGGVVLTRPTALQTPETRVLDVLRAYLTDATEVERVCLLVPTSPLRTLRHVVESRLLFGHGVDAVMSVTPFRQDVRYACTTTGTKRWLLQCDSMMWPAQEYLKSDGTCLWAWREWLLADATWSLYHGMIRPYRVPPDESVDIDTALDFAFAEFLLARQGDRA